MPQQSMLNEFNIPIAPRSRRTSCDSSNSTATPFDQTWGNGVFTTASTASTTTNPVNSASASVTHANNIWSTMSNPGRSPFADNVSASSRLDESPFESASVADGWRAGENADRAFMRRNSSQTDPTGHYSFFMRSGSFSNQAQPQISSYQAFRQQQQQQQQPQMTNAIVQPPAIIQQNQGMPPYYQQQPQQPQTNTPRFYNHQPLPNQIASTNLLDRFSQVAEATRETELLSSGMASLSMESNAPSLVQKRPSMVSTAAPGSLLNSSRSELNSPSSVSFRSENNVGSPYLSPTPVFASLDYAQASNSNQPSRSNSLTSLWNPQPQPLTPAAMVPQVDEQPEFNVDIDYRGTPAGQTSRSGSMNGFSTARAPQQKPFQATHARYSSRSGSTTSPTANTPASVTTPEMAPSQSPPAPLSRKDFSTMRSALLEEFRTSKTKKYELKDLYGHIVEFSGDQHGSRFIQQRLETATSEEKEAIFSEIRPNSLQLMTDVFGNYVIQKFFELGNQMQKTILAKQMETHILGLSLQMYGCRVVQKAVEHVLTDQQAALIKELDGHVLRCVKDQNGNHVIQKAIERIPSEHIGFILDAFHNQVYQLATHPYGCRVIQRMLEHSDEKSQQALLDELHMYTFYLVEDQYGNYVIQHVVQRGRPEDRAKIVNIVKDSMLTFSRHKYASNVVEKCITCASEAQRGLFIDEMLRETPGSDTIPIAVMMRDQFANYVVQKLLDVTKGEQHDRLVNAIKPQLQALKKYTYGKHLASIEKLMSQTQTPND